MLQLTLTITLATVFWLNTLSSQTAPKQASPLGTWLTTDDETGEAKSHIQIFEKDGRQYGKIIKVMRNSLNHPCDKCDGERKNKPVLGMVIIENMALSEGFWQGGRVLFPKQGKWYNLKYWLQPGNSNMLVVRGCMGPFYRTQYWSRVE